MKVNDVFKDNEEEKENATYPHQQIFLPPFILHPSSLLGR
jgi:hypothetical protein